MQKTLKYVLILTMVNILLLTTACSQAAVRQEKVTSSPVAVQTHEPIPESADSAAEEETTAAPEPPEADTSESEKTLPSSPETEKPSESVPVTEESKTSESKPLQTSAAVAETTEEADDIPADDAEPEPEDQPESSNLTVPTDGLLTIEDTKVAMSDSEPEPPEYPAVSAPGTREMRSGSGVIDYSNSSDGYVMAKYTSSTSNRLKALVIGPTTQYQYELTPGEWAAFPLSDGDGTYQIGIYENVRGTSYAQVVATSISVKLSDEFAPFLRSNQYVNFEAAPETILKASELCKDLDDNLEKVEAIYNYVVGEMSYDYDFADRVKGGSISSYVPDLDSVLSNGKGICLDYAGLMAGMLRSQCVPCKLVVGYTGTNYHAWISVWTEETGWIENTIYFDGSEWQRMDPTFASTGKKSSSTMKYIGDGKNYKAKFFY